MKRQIIKIDEKKCNGCGICVPNCPEGALQIIDGKARLVGELLCDGLGACIGRCPEGAITIEEREAEKYDEFKVMENVLKEGPNVIAAHLKHLKEHNQEEYYNQAIQYLKEKNMAIPKDGTGNSHGYSGCPGMMVKDFRNDKAKNDENEKNVKISSELNQWPIQLHLLNPHAPYFKDADLIIAADCVPFAFANFHQRFLKGKILIIFCPKLDQGLETYVEKLTEMFTINNIKSITILHMEVPCCYGTVSLVERALKQSNKSIIVKDYTISLQGEII
jgi:NAD-dependent dihydropyrimidine dehydrogenase PreA subunit